MIIHFRTSHKKCSSPLKNGMLPMLFVALGVFHGVEDCRAFNVGCIDGCECHWKNGQETIICKNLNLTTIPKRLGAGVTALEISGCNLMSLKEDEFLESNVGMLHKLMIVRCRVKYIDRNAFRTMRSLMELDMSYNAITIIPTLAFAHLPQLREFRIKGNPILKLGDYAFRHVPYLTWLDVSDCRIGWVSDTAFKGLEHSLRSVKLNGNRLVNLDVESFSSLQAISFLDVSNNPLNCSCSMRAFRDWLFGKIYSKALPNVHPLCRYPTHNYNKSITTLNDRDWACIPYIYLKDESNKTVGEGDNVTLSCGFSGYPEPLVTWTVKTMSMLDGKMAYPVSNKRSSIVTTPAEGTVLTITDADLHDSGLYICSAENVVGKVMAKTFLIVDQSFRYASARFSEQMVLMGILGTAVLIVFICAAIIFCRVVYFKKENVLSGPNGGGTGNTSSRPSGNAIVRNRVSSEKIEMKKRPSEARQLLSIHKKGSTSSVLALSASDKSENSSNRPHHPKSNANENNAQRKKKEDDSPRDSIFDSHIGEMALQHHVLHKKPLPAGRLYTTAMAFMTDDTMTGINPTEGILNGEEKCRQMVEGEVYQEEEQKDAQYFDYQPTSAHPTAAKIPENRETTRRNYHHGTMPRGFRVDSDVGNNLESQMPLLYERDGDYFDRFSGNHIFRNHRTNQYRNPNEQIEYERNMRCDPNEQIEYERNMHCYQNREFTHYDKEGTKLFDNYRRFNALSYSQAEARQIYSREQEYFPRRRSESFSEHGGGYNNYQGYVDNDPNSWQRRAHATTYDYHSVQLERFLEEYKQLHSELTKMKENCEKIKQAKMDEDSAIEMAKYNHLNRSMERSVSFVPTLRDSIVKSPTEDIEMVPKSILKKSRSPASLDPITVHRRHLFDMGEISLHTPPLSYLHHPRVSMTPTPSSKSKFKPSPHDRPYRRYGSYNEPRHDYYGHQFFKN